MREKLLSEFRDQPKLNMYADAVKKNATLKLELFLNFYNTTCFSLNVCSNFALGRFRFSR